LFGNPLALIATLFDQLVRHQAKKLAIGLLLGQVEHLPLILAAQSALGQSIERSFVGRIWRLYWGSIL